MARALSPSIKNIKQEESLKYKTQYLQINNISQLKWAKDSTWHFFKDTQSLIATLFIKEYATLNTNTGQSPSQGDQSLACLRLTLQILKQLEILRHHCKNAIALYI